MDFSLDATIAAIASPPGAAARGIIRVSGPDSSACIDRLFHGNDTSALRDRRRTSVKQGAIQWDDDDGPCRVPCLLYCWPSGRSFTRQPIAELHLPGSPPLLEQVLAAVCRSGARLARPGEFTLRAFLAGRVDLTQAEAILGVVDAGSQRELDVALRQLAGGIGTPLRDLREHLLDSLAHLEAGLDFADEDISFITSNELARTLDDAIQRIDRIADQMRHRQLTIHRPRVVLIGAPNAGKSTLFNALCGTDALVSQQAGTTRDFLSATCQLGPLEIELVDTAGIDSLAAHDALSLAAQQRSTEQRDQAHICLFCLDASRPLSTEDRNHLAEPQLARIVVLTKCDLPRRCEYAGPAIETSAHQSTGFSELGDAVRRRLEQPDDVGVVAATAARCAESLHRAEEGLSRARRLVASPDYAEELVASELRAALDELAAVVGAVYTDDLLDRIFSRFCIGK